MENGFNRHEERLATVVKLADARGSARDALVEEYRQRSEAAFAPQTLRNLILHQKKFSRWCASTGHDPTPPVPPQVVAAYVDALAGDLKATTISNALWAIAESHRSRFVPSPCKHRLVDLAMKAARRKYGAGMKQAPPLCKREVLTIIASLGDSRMDVRDKAVLWIASDSWCRASEIVAFRVRDLCRQPDGSSLLYVTRSKTDPFGDGAYSYLSEAGTNAVLRWVRMAALKERDPLVTKWQRNARIASLNPTTVSRIIKRRSGRRELSAHSTRVGGVQDALRLGCDLSSIMVAGRWKSPEMPARYGRTILASQSAAAQVSESHKATVEELGLNGNSSIGGEKDA